jgi:hypothetical protein
MPDATGNDGGPAFPRPGTPDERAVVQGGAPGMTLWQWYAGKAIEGLAANPAHAMRFFGHPDELTAAARLIANEMVSGSGPGQDLSVEEIAILGEQLGKAGPLVVEMLEALRRLLPEEGVPGWAEEAALVDGLATRAKELGFNGIIVHGGGELEIGVVGIESPAVVALRERIAQLEQVLGPDAAGRPFHQLLAVTAVMISGYGDGPLAECLRLKAGELETTASLAPADVEGHGTERVTISFTRAEVMELFDRAEASGALQTKLSVAWDLVNAEAEAE